MNPDAGNIIVRSQFPDMTRDDLPDPDEPFHVDPTELEAIRYVVRELGDTHFIIGRSPLDGTFPWDLTVGMEKFLMSMITDPDFVQRAIDVYVKRSIEYFKVMLEAGVDAIMTVDDYSDNRGADHGQKTVSTIYFCREFSDNARPFMNWVGILSAYGWKCLGNTR